MIILNTWFLFVIASLLPKPATSSCLEISDRIRVQPILDPHIWNDTQSLKQNIITVTQHNLPSLIIKQININSHSDVDSLFKISRSCCKTQLPGMKQNPPPWRYAPERPVTFHPLVSDASGRPPPDCSPNCKDFLKNWFTDWNNELYRIALLPYYYLKHHAKCTIYLCMIEKVAILQIFQNTVGPRCFGSCQNQTCHNGRNQQIL